MRMLGAQSQREVLRARHRVLTAMRIQACEQGRCIGGLGALIRVDQDHAETVDLSHPLLAVPLSEVGTPIVI
ncbi:hypothetical protein [Actinomadura sp. K4S16]|uniref:hypothetical protein n=1 Tax=Actinomadura sp. K4S16 TaxID=1316147 RepID=UPI00190F2128|nr:hypothetical protein [Actinomadura sp. K4S16]